MCDDGIITYPTMNSSENIERYLAEGKRRLLKAAKGGMMTHDNVRDALEYTAVLLEQLDAGGTLPDKLREIANDYLNLQETVSELKIALKPFAAVWTATEPIYPSDDDYRHAYEAIRESTESE